MDKTPGWLPRVPTKYIVIEAVLTRELAILVQKELKKVADVNPVLYKQNNDAYKVLKNGGVKRRGDLLVMNTVKKRYGISHALIETCFIDDADDMALYRKTKPYVARAIAAGIAESFGLKYEDTGIQTGTVAQEDNNKMTNAEIQKIAKKAAQDVVQATFTSIYDKANPLFTSLGQVPDYWQQEVSEMIQCGAIKGDGTHEISIRHDALQAAVIAFRAAVEINK